MPRLLRIARGDGTYLNLEFRQPGGTFETFSSGSPVANGVSVRIAPELTSLAQSQLLDATPATSSYSDSALATGASLTDSVADVTITDRNAGPRIGITQNATAHADPPVPWRTQTRDHLEDRCLA